MRSGGRNRRRFQSRGRVRRDPSQGGRNVAGVEMILVIDNYDSFVYNLARYLRELGCTTEVVRNDAITVRDVERLGPQAVVISPGPCTPAEAGISVEVVRSLSA